MSNISKLIEELCPDGVEFKPLENFLDYAQPSKYIVSHTNYSNDFKTPVLTPGKTFILGYTDDIDGIFDASDECPVILFDDFTTSFRWIDFKFKVKSSAVKILSSKDSEVSFKYIYYAMKTIRYETLDHSRQWISNYSKIKIPVPPLGVQEEIVRILDRFTLLEAELEAELEARRKQYAFYREFMLKVSNENSVRYTLGKIGPVRMCKRILKRQTSPVGDIPFYKIGTFGKKEDSYISKDLYDEYRSKYHFPKKGDLLISAAGTIGRIVEYNGDDAYYQDSNIVWLDNDESIVLNSYLKHFYRLNPWRAVTGGTISRLYNDLIRKVEILVPPIEEQQRIVDILDRFDALVNDISSGLPAEIAARRKQYEYYRDQLLTFKELEPVSI